MSGFIYHPTKGLGFRLDGVNVYPNNPESDNDVAVVSIEDYPVMVFATPLDEAKTKRLNTNISNREVIQRTINEQPWHWIAFLTGAPDHGMDREIEQTLERSEPFCRSCGLLKQPHTICECS